MHNKILDLDELARQLDQLRAEGKKVVLSHGVFDLLHVGHIRHFEQAKRMGDVLVVTLTQDQFVNKGPHRPAFPENVRAESLAALRSIDFVAVNRWPRSVETIRLLKPDVYAKGPDYKIAEKDITGGITAEAEAIREIGGEIRFTEDVSFSSSQLLNKYFSPFTKEVADYLEGFRKRYSSDEILDWLDKASRVRALIVGEAIIDEYLFCTGIGKSTKDPVLAVLQECIEPVAGGTLAIANHLAGLCAEAGLLTQLGEIDRREEFVRGSLRSNIRPVFLTKSGSPTVRKRRIVDQYSGNKLLEVYVMDDKTTQGEDAVALRGALESELDAWDIAIVADYGHGMMTPAAIHTMCERAPFLAVNAQSNAGNRGFNPLSRYKRASYMCVAAHEARMELRDRNCNLKDAVLEIARRVDCPRFTVTCGKEGSIHFDRSSGFVEAPALATKIEDRVGAGDAVLAITSLLSYLDAPWEIIAFLGNVAGAELVGEVGSRVPLNRVDLGKHVVSLLK